MCKNGVSATETEADIAEHVLVLVLIVLRPKYSLEDSENSISRHLNFRIFWGVCPQTPSLLTFSVKASD